MSLPGPDHPAWLYNTMPYTFDEKMYDHMVIDVQFAALEWAIQRFRPGRDAEKHQQSLLQLRELGTRTRIRGISSGPDTRSTRERIEDRWLDSHTGPEDKALGPRPHVRSGSGGVDDGAPEASAAQPAAADVFDFSDDSDVRALLFRVQRVPGVELVVAATDNRGVLTGRHRGTWWQDAQQNDGSNGVRFLTEGQVLVDPEAAAAAGARFLVVAVLCEDGARVDEGPLLGLSMDALRRNPAADTPTLDAVEVMVGAMDRNDPVLLGHAAFVWVVVDTVERAVVGVAHAETRIKDGTSLWPRITCHACAHRYALGAVEIRSGGAKKNNAKNTENTDNTENTENTENAETENTEKNVTIVALDRFGRCVGDARSGDAVTIDPAVEYRSKRACLWLVYGAAAASVEVHVGARRPLRCTGPLEGFSVDAPLSDHHHMNNPDHHLVAVVTRAVLWPAGSGLWPLVRERCDGAVVLSGCLPRAVRVPAFPSALAVRVCRGRGLVARDVGGRSDPYVRLRVLVDGKMIKTTHRTTTQPKTLDPVWKKSEGGGGPFRFDLPDGARDVAVVATIKDEDRIGRPDPMGSVGVDLADAPLPFLDWLAVGADPEHDAATRDVTGDLEVEVVEAV